MPMIYRSEPDSEGKRVVACDVCGVEVITEWSAERVRHMCPGATTASRRGHGPGWHLATILWQLNIRADGHCNCFEMQVQMDYWGPEGCREHWDEIMSHLQRAYDEASIATKITALKKALSHGLPRTLAGLLTEAIKRSEDDGK